jgi:predicted RNase H-like HicB family nuclease
MAYSTDREGRGGSPREVRSMTAKAERVVEPVAPRLADTEARIARLQADIEALEADVERLEAQLVNQEFYLLDGYVAVVCPVGDGTFIASCPTLHASVQEGSPEAALASLREAVLVAKEGHRQSGRALPPRDVVARCLD